MDLETSADAFTADWASLDARPTPDWYSNAKFGVFIHWGLYSVPAWAPRGEYAEWYWEKLVAQSFPNPWRQRHDATYGQGFVYKDFAPQFRADLFDAGQWARLLEDSGARYVVLTSKHHDGYCLWPSREADSSYGRIWNSLGGAPKRDLVGELAEATRARGLKFGLYYSLYEWFHPIWRVDRARYVREHMAPQFKDLVARYAPSLVFADGEWAMSAEQWRAPEILAWLFNHAENADEVVINDRWGHDTRHRHGGYWTMEYGAGLPDASRPWEECRGLAASFGYNRAEALSDYTSAAELVSMLCDLVSRGGNLLLNIGPTADGRIPVIMQQRLNEIGDWLKVNGEAIFGSRVATRTCQWSPGERPGQSYGEFKVAYDVMAQIGPEPRAGRAVKQFWFTRKGPDIYAIATGWLAPRMTIAGLKTGTSSRVTLLGSDRELAWRPDKDGIVIDLLFLAPQDLPCQHAWTFRVTAAELLADPTR